MHNKCSDREKVAIGHVLIRELPGGARQWNVGREYILRAALRTPWSVGGAGFARESEKARLLFWSVL